MQLTNILFQNIGIWIYWWT